MTRHRGCAVAIACIGVGLLAGLSVLHQGSGDYAATRVRNALIATVGDAQDVAWAPQDAPQAFRRETVPAPALLQNAAHAATQHVVAAGGNTLDRALALAAHLRTSGAPGGGLKTDTTSAYRAIVAQQGGYCADYTQVMNGLGHAAGIPVREWGMSFDDYSGDGHAFSEVYVAALGQWVFVDSFYSFWVRDRASGRPLSVLDLRRALLSLPADATMGAVDLEVVPITSRGILFADDAMALDYYRRGLAQVFLYLGNDVFSYDRHPLIGLLRPLPSSVEQLAAIAAGVHPRLLVLRDEFNTDAVSRLVNLRTRLAGAFLLAALAAAGTLVSGGACLRSSFRRAPSP